MTKGGLGHDQAPLVMFLAWSEPGQSPDQATVPQKPPPPPPLGDTTPAILAGTKRTENSFGIIWPSPRQLRVKNTLRVGHRGPVGRKTTQKPPQNTKKWKKIVKKRLFSRFGHFGQNSDFSRKKSKTGIFFDITKPPLAQIYPKSGL